MKATRPLKSSLVPPVASRTSPRINPCRDGRIGHTTGFDKGDLLNVCGRNRQNSAGRVICKIKNRRHPVEGVGGFLFLLTSLKHSSPVCFIFSCH